MDSEAHDRSAPIVAPRRVRDLKVGMHFTARGCYLVSGIEKWGEVSGEVIEIDDRLRDGRRRMLVRGRLGETLKVGLDPGTTLDSLLEG